MQPLPRVHPVERLVQQQHLRVVHQRGGHLDPLPHALGVGRDPPVLRVGHLHDVDGPARGRGPGRAACAAGRWPGRTPARSGTRTPSRRSGTRPTGGRCPGCASWPAPPTVISPRDGARKPAIMCSSVDLPAPFGPSRPVTPGPMLIVMSLTATTLPYQRDTLRSSIVRHAIAAFRYRAASHAEAADEQQHEHHAVQRPVAARRARIGPATSVPPQPLPHPVQHGERADQAGQPAPAAAAGRPAAGLECLQRRCGQHLARIQVRKQQDRDRADREDPPAGERGQRRPIAGQQHRPSSPVEQAGAERRGLMPRPRSRRAPGAIVPR